MAIPYILQLIAKGESEILDFKKTISSAPKIAKTLSAFANHKGGRLLIGVNDNGIISGVKSEDEKYMLDLAANFFCKPEITMKIIKWEAGNKIILEAIISEGKNKPFYAKDENGKWWAHIRVKDQSLLASKVVVDVLRRNSTKQGTLLTYSKHEESLLKFLDKEGRITLKELCKFLNISRWRAQKILVNLLSIGILRSHSNEKGEFYTMCSSS